VLSFDSVYANVDLGLQFPNINDKLKAVYNNTEVRIIVEALYFDENTPKEVYSDLVGFEEQDVEDYRNYFFNIPTDTPRLELLNLINSIPKYFRDGLIEQRSHLFNTVFKIGWSIIDSEFNKSKWVNSETVLKLYANHIIVNLRDNLMASTRSGDLLEQKKLLSVMKDANGIIKANENKVATQLELDFVNSIQQAKDEGSKSLFNEVFTDSKVNTFGQLESAKNENYDLIMKDLEEGKTKNKKKPKRATPENLKLF